MARKMGRERRSRRREGCRGGRARSERRVRRGPEVGAGGGDEGSDLGVGGRGVWSMEAEGGWGDGEAEERWEGSRGEEVAGEHREMILSLRVRRG